MNPNKQLAERPESRAIPDTDVVLVVEAQRRGREVLSRAETAIAEFGQWLFANVFVDDARAVLDRPITSPVWAELLRSAESDKLPLTRVSLSNALRVAALDKRLSDAAWTRLSFSHKVALLALTEPKALRAAARHVLAASLSVRQTRAYVVALRDETGEAAPKLSPAKALRSLGSVSGRFERAQDVRRFGAQLAKLDDAQRARAEAQLEALIAAFSSMLTSVRGDTKRR
ncbi:MAG: hypothetical protein Q8Q09_19855 [Deltaproteobacteria bacterium]|nr:hypothetical protein [Deltaproteobacteria bacterium]